MKKVVVTGGAGFIGSNLVRGLLERGYEVKVIDNLSTGRRENLQDIVRKIDFLEADIRDFERLRKELAGMEIVFHQAALPSVPRSIADPIACNENNIAGTLNVLQAAREAGVRRVVYAASSSAYGNAAVEYKTEELPANPLSPYALTKYVGEVYCRLFHELYGLETIALRYFNVFGPRQDPESQYAAVIPKFICAMLKGEAPIIYGDGKQSRDFTFVANNVEANILAAESKDGSGEVFNVACGDSIDLNRLVELINQELGTKIEPVYQPARSGDVLHSKADISKAGRVLGFKPTHNFEQGLKAAILWYKNLK